MPHYSVANLIGPALDMAVALAHRDAGLAPVAYSTDWRFGGPIIERANISVVWNHSTWVATTYNDEFGKWEGHAFGPTPLIAAMRCYVASKIGDSITLE